MADDDIFSINIIDPQINLTLDLNSTPIVVSANPDWKTNARVATTGNININLPGTTIDGITLHSLDRILVKNQNAAAENGIFIYLDATTAMPRASDANTGDLLELATITVEEGTSHDVTYRQTNYNFVIGVDPVLWETFGKETPNATESLAGKAQIATQSEVDAGIIDTDIITPLKLKNWASLIRKVTSVIGDASATTYTVTHNFNTLSVNVQVFNNSYQNVWCDVIRLDANSVSLTFKTAPAINDLTVVIIG